MPVHLQPYYRNLGFREGCFPEAERHGAEAISLPIWPNLSTDDQDHTISVLRNIVQENLL